MLWPHWATIDIMPDDEPANQLTTTFLTLWSADEYRQLEISAKYL